MSERGDIIDQGNERAEKMTEASISEARYQASLIEPGEPGVCDLCGEWSGRLVRGACAPCRDRYRLP